MTLRILLLRLLLVAAFFNAAIGMPLHEWAHLKELVATVSQGTEAHDAAADDGQDAEVHGRCAWCAAHEAQGMALPLFASIDVPTVVVGTVGVGHDAAFVPQGWHWRFAARDPPLALS